MRGHPDLVPNCGTNAGYRWHYNHGQKPCDACGKAHAAHMANYRKRAYLARGRTTVPGIGTQRRVRALAAIGYSSRDLSACLGWHPSMVRNLGKHGTRVTAPNAEKIAALYDEISGTPGGNRRAQTLARNRGWPPPLDWEGRDIDDPKALSHSQHGALVRAGLARVKGLAA